MRASDNGPPPPARYGQNDRSIAIGRKNYLFAGSDAGGRRAAAMDPGTEASRGVSWLCGGLFLILSSRRNTGSRPRYLGRYAGWLPIGAGIAMHPLNVAGRHVDDGTLLGPNQLEILEQLARVG